MRLIDNINFAEDISRACIDCEISHMNVFVHQAGFKNIIILGVHIITFSRCLLFYTLSIS